MSFYNHPAFAGIDPKFLAFMDRTMQTAAKSNDQTAIIAALMTISNEAKKQQINFTPDRQQALILHLRNNLPPQKRPQFDMLVSMMKGKM